MEIRPIGVIRSPHERASGTPAQPAYAVGGEGEVVLDAAYVEGLKDLEGFDRIWLVSWLDRGRAFRLNVVPYRDDEEHGLFATRAPSRPNPIGISCVRLLRIEGNRLVVSELDLLDGTPLLDIKPYVPDFDIFPDVRAGWLDRVRDDPDVATEADERFSL